MFDYLSDAVADYTTTTLNIRPQKTLPTTGDKSQIVHKFDDGSVKVIGVSDTSYFDITLVWTAISDDDAGTIMDLWHDPAKANGRENTFYWEHPTDGHTYVARFMSPFKFTFTAGMVGYQKVGEIDIRVEGRKAES